jgi:hypothetical protein
MVITVSIEAPVLDLFPDPEKIYVSSGTLILTKHTGFVLMIPTKRKGKTKLNSYRMD